MTGSPRIARGGGRRPGSSLPATRARCAVCASGSSLRGWRRSSSGSIGGVVQDEKGAPIPGAMVSALGAKTATAVTDRGGRFEIRTLRPGPYLVRAHITGYVGSRGQIVEVRASARTSSSIALRHAGSVALPHTVGGGQPALLAAGLGGAAESQAPVAEIPVPAPRSGRCRRRLAGRGRSRRDRMAPATSPSRHSERHHRSSRASWQTQTRRKRAAFGAMRRQVCRGVRRHRRQPLRRHTVYRPIQSADDRLVRQPARSCSAATIFRAASPMSRSRRLSATRRTGRCEARSPRAISRPGSWQGPTRRAYPARHRFDLGLSYSTQRYDGGNPCGAARRLGRKPQRGRALWVRHFHSHARRGGDVRRPFFALRLSGREQSLQPAC